MIFLLTKFHKHIKPLQTNLSFLGKFKQTKAHTHQRLPVWLGRNPLPLVEGGGRGWGDAATEGRNRGVVAPHLRLVLAPHGWVPVVLDGVVGSVVIDNRINIY